MYEIWMAVTPDKYEFPIAVADTPQELAKLLNFTTTKLFDKFNRKKSTGVGRKRNFDIKRVKVNSYY